jgi:hypothetical protein
MESWGKETGNFRSPVELISRYDKTPREHVENYKKGSVIYFSPRTQNEITNFVGIKNQGKTITAEQKSKYSSVPFDIPPNTGRKDQLTQNIRYVKVNDTRKIEERFVDFINTKEK